jgi:hypothetical protein
MDPSPDVLVDAVRAKRREVDHDLEMLRARARQMVDPRRLASWWNTLALPIAGGAAALWLWRRHRRAVDGSRQDLPVRASLVDPAVAGGRGPMTRTANAAAVLLGGAATQLARTVTRRAMHDKSGAPRVPRAARRRHGVGAMLAWAAAVGVLLALADVLQEQRKASGPDA